KSVFDQPLIVREPKPEDKPAEETGTAEPLEASPNVKETGTRTQPAKTTRKSVFDQPLIVREPKPEDKSAEETGTAQGDAEVKYRRGYALEYGDGVDTDTLEAVKLYREAADLGHAKAMDRLGSMYFKGSGVEKNPVEAVRWFRAGAEKGCVRAQFNLAVCLYKGNGVAKNQDEAIMWYRKAAASNYASAQFNLGMIIYRSAGIPAEKEEAIRLFEAAAAQGHEKAKLVIKRYRAQGTAATKDAGKTPQTKPAKASDSEKAAQAAPAEPDAGSNPTSDDVKRAMNDVREQYLNKILRRYAGQWETPWGKFVTATGKGLLRGQYARNGGKLQGKLARDEESVNAEWKETNGDSGTMTLQLDEDGKTLVARWEKSDKSDKGEWKGKPIGNGTDKSNAEPEKPADSQSPE
ncbi:MAG: tetratricopeptide repeat protein, partial [bacterium]